MDIFNNNPSNPWVIFPFFCVFNFSHPHLNSFHCIEFSCKVSHIKELLLFWESSYWGYFFKEKNSPYLWKPWGGMKVHCINLFKTDCLEKWHPQHPELHLEPGRDSVNGLIEKATKHLPGERSAPGNRPAGQSVPRLLRGAFQPSQTHCGCSINTTL